MYVSQDRMNLPCVNGQKRVPEKINSPLCNIKTPDKNQGPKVQGTEERNITKAAGFHLNVKEKCTANLWDTSEEVNQVNDNACRTWSLG